MVIQVSCVFLNVVSHIEVNIFQQEQPYNSQHQLQCGAPQWCERWFRFAPVTSSSKKMLFAYRKPVREIGVMCTYPIGSMYGIYGNMDPINIPSMLALIYQHHGSYGYVHQLNAIPNLGLTSPDRPLGLVNAQLVGDLVIRSDAESRRSSIPWRSTRKCGIALQKISTKE